MYFLRLPRFVASFLLTVPVLAAAQMHHVDAPEQVTRAIGVYEWTGDLAKPHAERVVPVSLFIHGDFRDAGTYLARPVPFALETGNVYEIQFSGAPQGTVDVKMARDVAENNSGDDNPDGSWYAYGNFAPPAVPKKSTLKPSVALAAVQGTEDDDRPHFVTPRPDASATSSTTSTAPKHTPSQSGDANETERPTLRHRDDTQDADNSKDKKPKRQKPQGYVTSVGDIGDDPDRPTLRHGKAPSDDVPPLEGLPADMHQSVAVSDAATHEPHAFARPWESATERADTLTAVEALAKKAVAEYLQSNGLIPAKATDTTPEVAPTLKRTPHGIPQGRHAAAAKPAASQPLVLANEQMRGFQLSYGGLPTFVYTASLPVKPAKADSAVLDTYVALVAQQLPSGQLQVSLTSVTDSGHLNRAPWMRFVDVVDADGSHRASMLFELRAAHSRQFALYRLISANAEQTFVTRPMM